MGLSVGIAGLPNVGKTTLLNALTHAGADASNYPFCTIEQNVGIAAVPDLDLRRLQSILSPQETIPATVRFVDIAGLVEGASKGEGLGNKFLGHIREVDALLHVVRCFDDPNVTHAPGAPDPVRDASIVETEFFLADLETAERALKRWGLVAKSGREGKEEAAIFERAAQALSRATPVSDLDLTERERELLAEARFLTDKPCLYVANTGEDDPEGQGPLVQALVAAKGAERVLPVSIRLEAEVSELPPEEQIAFLQGLGLEKTALDLVLAACARLLGLITFYTMAHEKLQAWHLRRGSTAQQAAGKIHSDMERGFIRAEVMALEDLATWGSRQALHDHGRIQVVGRDHVVQDKDVLQIHFKV
ncbi:MAG TPA: redox-regulated ATPase YchF [Candidatus Krumholzibacteria bacterium]|nr:redox-regulated ATPase YchF [Candidatus Krumholzibacteria bacterium]